MTSGAQIRKTLLLVWPLLFGIFMIMVGNGLQGTLLALRAELAGFSVSVIGIIMSLYYCGYLAGWFIVPPMIRSVGHIRVFAGFASMASTTILVQGLFVDPYIWSFVRLISGLSFVGLFIVAESWINDIATNKLRAQILSAYLFFIHAGMFAGQFLINIGPLESMGLFVLVSILISLSLLPVTLANKPSPGFQEQESLPIKKLFKTSPLSVASVVATGLVSASMFTIAPVYGQLAGFSLPKISLLMGLYVAGCAIIPLIMGWLSDRMDRRKVIIMITGCLFVSCVVCILYPHLVMWLAFVIGGGTISLYGVSAAMLNDRLKPGQVTSATATLIFINGAASCVSPILVGFLMDALGYGVFFAVFACGYCALFAYGLYRAWVGPEIDVNEQADFQPLPARSSPNFAQIGSDD